MTRVCDVEQLTDPFASNWVPMWAGAVPAGSPQVGRGQPHVRVHLHHCEWRFSRRLHAFSRGVVCTYRPCLDLRPPLLQALAAVQALNDSGLLGVGGVAMSLTDSGGQR